jgi:UDP-N-acetylglucosamine--N-acetylmuramyl-(pentapeptide) pyrophosphoryl-undecaprenol N-acetylglucosamine transferase
MWATGKRDYEKMFYLMREKGYDKLKNIKLYDYIYDMPEKIAMADIIICRSGAMTVSEMAISGKCAIFIPSPNVTDNHQYKNAKLLDEKNAAILVPEERIYELVDVVKDLIFDDNKIKGYENRILNFANKNSNKQIYEEIIRLVKSK